MTDEERNAFARELWRKSSADLRAMMNTETGERREMVVAEANERIAQMTPRYTKSFAGIKPDGSPRWLRMSVRPALHS